VLLTIEKLVYGGDGLARLPADEHGRGKAVFLPFVLESEAVEASLLEQKPGFARARADAITQSSTHRIEALCPYFRQCGGCHYQHASYAHQLEIKAAILKENLRRIAKLELDTELIVHPSPPWNYRNRARLKIQTQPDFALGYHKFNSHSLLPVEQCPISSPLINRAITALWQMGRTRALPVEVHEIELFANAEDSELLLEVYCAPAIRSDVAKLAAQELKTTVPEVTGVVMCRHARNLSTEAERIATHGSGEIVYKTVHSSYRVSAGAFFQVNRHLTGQLLQIVTEDQSGDTALDLYAGVGLFSAALSRSFAQVIAVESSPTSYADLLYNSQPNVKTVQSTTDQFLKNRAGNHRPDLVVVDPPRSGLGEMVVRRLAGLGARQVTYVSCDPATLSRDLAGLLHAGYRIRQAHVVDLFPQTYHLESVFQLVSTQ
jgi:23S rRNA (uracil1939-C5)-methyltransferase